MRSTVPKLLFLYCTLNLVYLLIKPKNRMYHHNYFRVMKEEVTAAGEWWGFPKVQGYVYPVWWQVHIEHIFGVAFHRIRCTSSHYWLKWHKYSQNNTFRSAIQQAYTSMLIKDSWVYIFIGWVFGQYQIFFSD